MILSNKPIAPLTSPCPCGCGATLIIPRQVRHVVRQRWRYKLEMIQRGGQWGGVSLGEQHYFQPRHRRARRWWRVSRVHHYHREPRPRRLTPRR